MTNSSVLIALPFIKKFERFRANAYRDSVNIATVGYGSTFLATGVPVKMTDTIMEPDALKLLFKSVEILSNRIEKHSVAFASLNNHQKAACLSLAYNVGVTAFLQSTLLKKIESGDLPGASLQFGRWNKAGGKVLVGLVSRREEERKMFNYTIGD
jgi:lysozyme